MSVQETSISRAKLMVGAGLAATVIGLALGGAPTAAAIKGGEDQLIDAFLGGQFRSRQQRADFRIADFLGQAIATQQDLHAGAEVPAHQFHAQ